MDEAFSYEHLLDRSVYAKTQAGQSKQSFRVSYFLCNKQPTKCFLQSYASSGISLINSHCLVTLETDVTV